MSFTNLCAICQHHYTRRKSLGVLGRLQTEDVDADVELIRCELICLEYNKPCNEIVDCQSYTRDYSVIEALLEEAHDLMKKESGR